MKDYVIFNLKRMWEINGKTVDLWEEIKSGRKTSEWRFATNRWINKLMGHVDLTYLFFPKDLVQEASDNQTAIDLTKHLMVHKAWFVIGYPKNSEPRLEATITKLLYWPYCVKDANEPSQLEIQFSLNDKEAIKQ